MADTVPTNFRIKTVTVRALDFLCATTHRYPGQMIDEMTEKYLSLVGKSIEDFESAQAEAETEPSK